MFSITLKRSAATLGVVAGLLAAATPASAQILDGPLLAKAVSISSQVDPVDYASWGPIVYVGTDGAGLTPARNLNDVEAIDFNALGTQVGSEGVKAPKPDTKGAYDYLLMYDGVKAPDPTDGTVAGSRNGGEVVSADSY